MIEEDFIDAEVINVELRKDIVSDILWRTKEGRRVRVGDMEDTHLRNTVLFLTHFGYQKCIASMDVRLKWLRIFQMEWQKRMLAKASGKRIYKVSGEEAYKALKSNVDWGME